MLHYQGDWLFCENALIEILIFDEKLARDDKFDDPRDDAIWSRSRDSNEVVNNLNDIKTFFCELSLTRVFFIEKSHSLGMSEPVSHDFCVILWNFIRFLYFTQETYYIRITIYYEIL